MGKETGSQEEVSGRPVYKTQESWNQEKNSYCCPFASSKVLDGDTEVGWGSVMEELAAQPPVENLSYSLICEKYCATVGAVLNNGVIAGL